jgi:hypothetical protein
MNENISFDKKGISEILNIVLKIVIILALLFMCYMFYRMEKKLEEVQNDVSNIESECYDMYNKLISIESDIEELKDYPEEEYYNLGDKKQKEKELYLGKPLEVLSFEEAINRQQQKDVDTKKKAEDKIKIRNNE